MAALIAERDAPVKRAVPLSAGVVDASSYFLGTSDRQAPAYATSKPAAWAWHEFP